MDDRKYQEAKEWVRDLKDFYRNLITYLAIILLLLIINLLTSLAIYGFFGSHSSGGSALSFTPPKFLS